MDVPLFDLKQTIYDSATNILKVVKNHLDSQIVVVEAYEDLTLDPNIGKNQKIINKSPISITISPSNDTKMIILKNGSIEEDIQSFVLDPQESVDVIVDGNGYVVSYPLSISEISITEQEVQQKYDKYNG